MGRGNATTSDEILYGSGAQESRGPSAGGVTTAPPKYTLQDPKEWSGDGTECWEAVTDHGRAGYIWKLKGGRYQTFLSNQVRFQAGRMIVEKVPRPAYASLDEAATALCTGGRR